MLNILINAYACSPNWGSEPGMAWNWVTNLAKYCNLHIITEGEWRNEIEAAVAVHPYKDNLHFYYNPVPDKVRKMCWNQGDWRFYIHYRKWQKKTLCIARDICRQEKIDVLHQLNMIGFREPGLLWKIEGIPFVWGPIGGYAGMPQSYLCDAGIKAIVKENIKNVVNYFMFRLQPRVRKAVKHAAAIVGAYKETYEALRDVYRPDTVLINETGAFIDEMSKPHESNKKELNILWVGKFDLRKQLGVAIRTMELLKNRKNIHLWVAGSGYPKDVEKYARMVEDNGLKENVHFMGVVPNMRIRKLMKEMDLFLFTSVHDATSTVVPEAISAGLPVLCHDMRGFGVIVDDNIGRKVKPKSPEQSAYGFAHLIEDLNNNRDEIRRLSTNCIVRQKEISWEANARKMVAQYEKAIKARH